MFFKKSPSFTENDLQSVIKACISKNSQAQSVLIEQFYGYAMKICLPYSANRMEAEEMLNDSFLKVFNNLEKYDSLQSFKAWLRTIIVNTAINYYNKNKNYHNYTSEIAEVDLAIWDEDVLDKISKDEILELVHQLPPAYKMVFTLYVVEGYNHREIAERLGIKEGTSKSNLADARIKLQAMIRVNYPHFFEIYALKKNKLNEN